MLRNRSYADRAMTTTDIERFERIFALLMRSSERVPLENLFEEAVALAGLHSAVRCDKGFSIPRRLYTATLASTVSPTHSPIPSSARQTLADSTNEEIVGI